MSTPPPRPSTERPKRTVASCRPWGPPEMGRLSQQARACSQTQIKHTCHSALLRERHRDSKRCHLNGRSLAVKQYTRRVCKSPLHPHSPQTGNTVMGFRSSGSGERDPHSNPGPRHPPIDHMWLAHALWASVLPAVKWVGSEAAVRRSEGSMRQLLWAHVVNLH